MSSPRWTWPLDDPDPAEMHVTPKWTGWTEIGYAEDERGIFGA